MTDSHDNHSQCLEDYNRNAWDALVDQKNRWTIPVSPEQIATARTGLVEIVLTPCKPIPQEWLQPLKGKDVLCLAGAGGQQAHMLAAAGANVSVLDNSSKQLEQDQVVARREGLQIRSELGRMDDLSIFDDASFDLIVHPCSNVFAPDILPVWREAYRVLRTGGHLLSGISNPLLFMFDYAAWDEGKLIVRHKIPMSERDDLDDAMKAKIAERNEPFAVGHTLQDQIGGQIAAGFAITGFYEDNWSESENEPLAAYIDCFIATRATKI